jgi:hypothetical protein
VTKKQATRQQLLLGNNFGMRNGTEAIARQNMLTIMQELLQVVLSLLYVEPT